MEEENVEVEAIARVQAAVVLQLRFLFLIPFLFSLLLDPVHCLTDFANLLDAPSAESRSPRVDGLL